MPNYAKFLKDMVSRKTRIGEFETTAATEACLAMMYNKVPAKKTDPGSFTIPCSIGNNYTCKALCDPGASINLMSKSIFQKLGIGEAKPTTVMLQLADRSPFLATGRVLLDFENNELVVRVDSQQVKINMFKVMKYSADIEDFQVIGETTAFDPDSEVTCLSREYITNLGSTTTEQNFSEEMEQFNPEIGSRSDRQLQCRNQLSMLRLYLCKGFNNLLEQDDKGDVSAETTGPAPAEVSAGIQISAERLLCYWLIPKSE
ncbi:hypothetical protein V6N12_007764 [Hibiscus sabdariffa]|uniref:Uncharacterized protein n=1 Tax=Hibiscus sabdariffa TaxID=183260 RepID=A0ABR2F2R6_9ROSI